MKTKNLKRIVSILLCMIISSICVVMPTNAIEVENDVISLPYNYGVMQIVMYPAIIDSNGKIDCFYGASSSSTYWPNGQPIINLSLGDFSKYVYNNSGCNCWLFKVDYLSNTNIKYLTIEVNGEKETVYNTSSSSYLKVIPGDIKYFTYEVTWYFQNGETIVSGGFVDLR